MTEPSAKILADSISTAGHRVTTMEVTMHRFVLAEFNTHRLFSRNSASSRAIPVSKQVDRVRTDTAFPLSWPAEQKGMQGGDELTPQALRENWENAAVNMSHDAAWFHSQNLHKSVTNRLLEPFMWHTVIVTATNWYGFFEQRCSPLAQPEIRAVAELMQEAHENSKTELVGEGNWHLPYITDEDRALVASRVPFDSNMHKNALEILKKVSAARCARVSYLTQGGVRDLDEDLNLYDRLVSAKPGHWSPLEHVATPWGVNVEEGINLKWWTDGREVKPTVRTARVGNLTGWRQMRLEVEGVSL